MKAEKIYKVTRKQLTAAFRKWNADAAKTADGTKFLDSSVAAPSVSAATLIGYLADAP